MLDTLPLGPGWLQVVPESGTVGALGTQPVSLDFDVDASDIRYTAYTGPYGAQSQDYRAYLQEDNAVLFAANNPLSAVNGLTVVVGWPKGFVEEPTQLQRLAWLVKDNINLLVALGGFVLLLLTLGAWRGGGVHV